MAIVLLLDVRFLWSLLSQGCTRTPHTLAQAQIATFAGKLESFRHDSGRMPESLEELTRPVFAGPYAHERELSDPWGRPLYYRVEDGGRRFVLFSLGEDGRLGGEDQDADIGYEQSRADDIQR